MRTYYVYILSNRTRTLYTGVTSDLRRRLHAHRARAVPGFTRRYHVTRLVYVETATNPRSAIAREKQLKRWRRAKKLRLIEGQNPHWLNLAESWGLGSSP